MAEECNWWPDMIHATSLSCWSTTNNPWNQQNNSSNSSGEDDVSMFTTYTNVSNDQSGISVESSTRRLVECVSTDEMVGETAGSHNQPAWNHVFLTDHESCGDLQNTRDFRENLLDEFSSEPLSTRMFDPPPYDYLKKMDNGWDFTSSLYINSTSKRLNQSPVENQNLDNLSNHQIGSCSWNILGSPGGTMDRKFSSTGRIGHDIMKVESEGGTETAGTGSFPKFFSSSSNGGTNYEYQMNSIKNSTGDRYGNGLTVPDTQWNKITSVADFVTSRTYPNKPLIEKLNLSDSKKWDLQTSNPFQSSITRSNGKTPRNRTEPKKKRSEETFVSTVNVKKPMLQHTTISSSAKTPVPKVKFTDKITALQQIVSPFGKTDTASVLWESICYVRFLQEQIQLLSNPYMKSNSCKNPWGGVEMGKMVTDLRSRGLCLVPISCTPLIYGDNNGSDHYFTPPYRGSLNR